MLDAVKDALWGGVDFDELVNGGAQCSSSASVTQRALESIATCSLSIFVLLKFRHRIYKDIASEVSNKPHLAGDHSIFSPASVARISVLVFTLVFGVEVGFKLATRNLIWVVYPCHVVTMTILLALTMPQTSVTAKTLLRLSTYWLNGGTVALIVPVTVTRQLTGEVFTYFAQHVLLLLVPLCLMATCYYRPDPLFDLAWPACAAAIMTIYYFGFLVPLSVATNLNFGYMLCAAPGDPMPESIYRLCHFVSQNVVAILTGKFLVLLSQIRVYKVD